MPWTRRAFLAAAGLSASCASTPSANDSDASADAARMSLTEFQPKSMLVAPETLVPRAKFPVIDVHTHLFFAPGLRRASDPDAEPSVTPADRLQEIVGWMDELNLRTMVNLTGGWGDDLRLAVESLAAKHPGRFVVCAEPAYTKISEPNYPRWQADEIGRAKQAGAVGLKVLKTLGLYLRENLTEGPLVKIDDPRFDPMWEAAGDLGLPVFIHTADPDAFFTPTDRFNERWEELGNHPDWSFHGGDFPSKSELLEARNRVVARHPRTQFVGLHVANHSEHLDEVSEWFERYPNLHCEIGARLGELGRQPRASRRFFEKNQDRILFGTDAIPLPRGANYPQQTLEPEMFRIYFRFLETEDEYFDYSPAATPPQGRWKISGIGLPDAVLEKVYNANAARLLPLG